MYTANGFNPIILDTDEKVYVHLGERFKYIYYIKRKNVVYINLDYVDD